MLNATVCCLNPPQFLAWHACRSVAIEPGEPGLYPTDCQFPADAKISAPAPTWSWLAPQPASLLHPPAVSEGERPISVILKARLWTAQILAMPGSKSTLMTQACLTVPLGLCAHIVGIMRSRSRRCVVKCQACLTRALCCCRGCTSTVPSRVQVCDIRAACRAWPAASREEPPSARAACCLCPDASTDASLDSCAACQALARG